MPEKKEPLEKERLLKEYGSGNLHELTVSVGPIDSKHPDKTKKITAYLRNPTISELDMVMSGITRSPATTKVMLAKTVYVGGDENFINIITEGHPDYDFQTTFRVVQFVEQITGVGLGEFKTL